MSDTGIAVAMLRLGELRLLGTFRTTKWPGVRVPWWWNLELRKFRSADSQRRWPLDQSAKTAIDHISH